MSIMMSSCERGVNFFGHLWHGVWERGFGESESDWAVAKCCLYNGAWFLLFFVSEIPTIFFG